MSDRQSEPDGRSLDYACEKFGNAAEYIKDARARLSRPDALTAVARGADGIAEALVRAADEIGPVGERNIPSSVAPSFLELKARLLITENDVRDALVAPGGLLRRLERIADKDVEELATLIVTISEALKTARAEDERRKLS
jgi:hypothetical protein